ncbi:DUF2934 domain-containing protein [Nitrospira sp. BLG_2]|uniref:DUF2934 domain-containing protein n=1 Tax=Nitrospira sp. BLG_2 TaxID=3397507 RepID=UPI003B9C2BD2
MARMPSEKNKKRASEKGEETKAAKSAGRSEKEARDPAVRKRIGPEFSAGSRKREAPQPLSPMRLHEDESREKDPVGDWHESQNLFQGMMSNGSGAVESDSATHRRIAERAFILFQENGCEHGNDWSHWFEAERLIKDSRV